MTVGTFRSGDDGIHYFFILHDGMDAADLRFAVARPRNWVFIRVDGVLTKDRSANRTEEEEMTPMMPPA